MTPEAPGSPGRVQAVVIGVGMAGLLTARVLAEHFRQVIVLDRDELPTYAAHRTGVPQGAHVHALFTRGLRTVEELLPGFTAALLQRGGQNIDVGADLAIHTPYGWGVRSPSALRVVGASRPLIEAVVREQITALPGVRLLDRHHVEHPIGTRHRVTAVRVRDLRGGTTADIPAQLVVDASGRGSRLPAWLKTLGCPEPVPESVVDPQLSYATRLYRRSSADGLGWRACYSLLNAPATTRGAVIAPIEDGRWIVTLLGIGPDRPTRQENDFLPFAASLPTAEIAHALQHMTPLTPVATSRATANRRRHLDRAPALPANLFVLGDAACAFNPIYAQGMTVAALGARLLGACLRGPAGPTATAARFHRRLSRLIDGPWLLATSADQRFPLTQGPAPSLTRRLMADHLDRVLAAGARNPQVQHAFLKVLTMVDGPSSLAAPATLLRTLRHSARTVPSPVPGPCPATRPQSSQP
ncbi:NAD(P)/FAD-dependent oxidoreductase [Streptomyces sp. NPDC127190]|uniref:NAD(P)/FAD-dependent oxidoreductase n=1 Tax=unclassified Streptomyces TaxID=2593676 RepID=UPI00363D932C